MVTITGSNFGPSADRNDVRFNGSRAPVLSVSADGTAIQAVVPYRAALTPNVWLWVESNGVRSAGIEIPVAAAQPGIFRIEDSTGAAITEDSPAAAGDVVSIIGDRRGRDRSAGSGRAGVGAHLSTAGANVRGADRWGVAAQVNYCGVAPSVVTGQLRVDVQVPAGLPSGDNPVVLTIGTASSQAGVVLPVR